MSEPRRWTLTGYGNLDQNDPGSRPIEVEWGPELGDGEEVEVIECLPGVIIVDDMDIDARVEEPSFSAEPRYRAPDAYVRRTWRKRIGNYRLTIERMNLRA